ncbi:MAG TPA: hypothetical protein VIK99_02150 [Thermaerobacter sp.]
MRSGRHVGEGGGASFLDRFHRTINRTINLSANLRFNSWSNWLYHRMFYLAFNGRARCRINCMCYCRSNPWFNATSNLPCYLSLRRRRSFLLFDCAFYLRFHLRRNLWFHRRGAPSLRLPPRLQDGLHHPAEQVVNLGDGFPAVRHLDSLLGEPCQQKVVRDLSQANVHVLQPER